MSSEDNQNQDPLEDLLVFAGRREAVESDRSEQVEKQVFDHWQHLLELKQKAENRQRALKVGGFLALAASLVLMINLIVRFEVQSPVVATVVTVVGDIEVGFRDQPMKKIIPGTVLRTGSILESSVDGGASLILVSGHDLRVSASSRVRLQNNAVVLDQGSVYIDSGLAGSENGLVVRTSFGTVRELGTQYLVSITDESVEISVREGSVNIERNSGPTLMARAGQALQVPLIGTVHREEILHYGDRWRWASDLAQPIQLEGHTLAEFFSWLSRENGWRVSYYSRPLEKRAERIELHGSILGLDSNQALASVIATVGWQFTLSNGVVTVSSSAAEQQ